MSCVHMRVLCLCYPEVSSSEKKQLKVLGAVSGCKYVMNQSLCIDFCTALSGRVGFDSQVIR